MRRQSHRIPGETKEPPRRATSGRESGSAVIIVMMLILVFLGMGAALVSLLAASRSGTELERKDVKAFNVAEAGIDAGMLALQQNWPEKMGQYTTVDATAIQAEFPANQYRGPQRSETPFIDVAIYNNTTGNPTTDGQTQTRVSYDETPDGRMWVASSSDVDDYRHRILVLAERDAWNLNLPDGIAIMANEIAGSGSEGIRVVVDVGQTGMAWAKYVSANGSGQNPAITYGSNVYQWPTGWPTGLPVPDPTNDANMAIFKTIATNEGTYFGPGEASKAQTFLYTQNAAANKIVYVEFGPDDSEIRFPGNDTFPLITGDDADNTLAKEQPLFLVLDTRNAPQLDNALVISGTVNFFGVICSNGDIEISGSAQVAGAMWSSGMIDARGTGNGNPNEVQYNSSIMERFEEAHTMSVSIVPNTWEEFTVPDAQ